MRDRLGPYVKSFCVRSSRLFGALSDTAEVTCAVEPAEVCAMDSQPEGGRPAVSVSKFMLVNAAEQTTGAAHITPSMVKFCANFLTFCIFITTPSYVRCDATVSRLTRVTGKT